MARLKWISCRMKNLKLEKQSDPLRWSVFCEVCYDRLESGDEFYIIKGHTGWCRIYWYTCSKCAHNIETIQESIFEKRLAKEKRKEAREEIRLAKELIRQYKNDILEFKNKLKETGCQRVSFQNNDGTKY